MRQEVRIKKCMRMVLVVVLVVGVLNQLIERQVLEFQALLQLVIVDLEELMDQLIERGCYLLLKQEVFFQKLVMK